MRMFCASSLVSFFIGMFSDVTKIINYITDTVLPCGGNCLPCGGNVLPCDGNCQRSVENVHLYGINVH